MRVLTIFIYLFFGFSISGIAQDQTSHPLIIGLGLSRCEIKYDNSNYDRPNSLGFSANITYQMSAHPIYNIVLGLKYSYLNFEATQPISWLVFGEGLWQGNSKISASHHQLSLPIMLKFTPIKIPLSLYAGGEIGFPFNGVAEIEHIVKRSSDNSVVFEGDSKYDYSRFLRDINIGYVIGIGYNVSIIGNVFIVSIKYYATLNSLFQPVDHSKELPPEFPLDTFIMEDMYQNELILSIGMQLN